MIVRQFYRLASVLIVLTGLIMSPAVLAQDFVWAPELQVGDSAPPIEAQDQNGEVQTLPDLMGESGLVLMFSRSFDW